MGMQMQTGRHMLVCLGVYIYIYICMHANAGYHGLVCVERGISRTSWCADQMQRSVSTDAYVPMYCVCVCICTVYVYVYVYVHAYINV